MKLWRRVDVVAKWSQITWRNCGRSTTKQIECCLALSESFWRRHASSQNLVGAWGHIKFLFYHNINLKEDAVFTRKKLRGAHLISRARSAALTLTLYQTNFLFFKIFIQRYTFYLLIFLWTDTKLIVTLEFREKFTRWKKPESFMITRAKISAVRASGVRRLIEGGSSVNTVLLPEKGIAWRVDAASVVWVLLKRAS